MMALCSKAQKLYDDGFYHHHIWSPTLLLALHHRGSAKSPLAQIQISKGDWGAGEIALRKAKQDRRRRKSTS